MAMFLTSDACYTRATIGMRLRDRFHLRRLLDETQDGTKKREDLDRVKRS
jgi:hypothetical protein